MNWKHVLVAFGTAFATAAIAALNGQALNVADVEQAIFAGLTAGIAAAYASSKAGAS